MTRHTPEMDPNLSINRRRDQSALYHNLQLTTIEVLGSSGSTRPNAGCGRPRSHYPSRKWDSSSHGSVESGAGREIMVCITVMTTDPSEWQMPRGYTDITQCTSQRSRLGEEKKRSRPRHGEPARRAVSSFGVNSNLCFAPVPTSLADHTPRHTPPLVGPPHARFVAASFVLK